MGDRRRWEARFSTGAVAVCLALLLVSTVLAGSVLPTPIGEDTYTNPDGQHRTQVEPDSFAHGNTVVTAFQTGRVFDGGASNIAWATTTNAGRIWTTGNLPGTTIHEGGPWARISDPSVAYDPEHDVWMISTLAFGMRLAAPLERRAPSSRADRPTAASRGRPRSPFRSARAASTTRTGSPATRGRRAPTTGTATRSGTTPVSATGS